MWNDERETEQSQFSTASEINGLVPFRPTNVHKVGGNNVRNGARL